MTYPGPEPAAESYGTAENVAALASAWTMSGEWLDADVYVSATNPSLTTVVRWIDQVSAMLNTALESYGFTAPLQSHRNQLSAASVVEGIVSDLARYANNKGRFYLDAATSSKEAGASTWQQIRNDLDNWVSEYAPGLEANGDVRNGLSIRMGFRSHDQAGKEVTPIFQRKAFGNTFENWDRK